ncbi:MAG: hypothetical protein NVS9B4_14760 [Candidatus Acidiferrum sp.]
MVSVAPVTLAVSVTDCETTRLKLAGETVTTTLLAAVLLLPPHPVNHVAQTASKPNAKKVIIRKCVFPTLSPTLVQIARCVSTLRTRFSWAVFFRLFNGALPTIRL